MATVTRIDRKYSFVTTFVFTNGKNGSEFSVPIDEADAYQTKIENATWTQLNNLFNLEGETVIKSN
jgi:hypothetical protein